MDIGRLTEYIIKNEGSITKKGRHMPYVDTVGKTTIGYGRNLTDNGISDVEARYLLANDIQSAINDLRAALPWFDSLDEVRQEVLVDLSFNMGISGLLKFKRTLDHIKNGEYPQAAAELLDSLYAEQTGHRALRNSLALESGSFQR